VTGGQRIDGVLMLWGERLFYPRNRIVKPDPLPRIDTLTRRKAAVIRKCIEAVVRRAPQVMVKVTGGGRGMGAIAAHFRYISKNGRLEIEDDRGVVRTGKEALRDVVDQWRFGGSHIQEEGHRREAFNLMLSMPAGTDAGLLQKAVREFARIELGGHRYVMVLHEHQANPHVHLSVRAESRLGGRLNPRKADLQRWRETFAEKLRGWGIDAEATRQAARGESLTYEPLWRLKAKSDGRLRHATAPLKAGDKARGSRAQAMVSWAHIARALADSEASSDRELAKHVAAFIRGTPYVRQLSEGPDRVGSDRQRGGPAARHQARGAQRGRDSR
jgi:hypothetical protein